MSDPNLFVSNKSFPLVLQAAKPSSLPATVSGRIRKLTYNPGKTTLVNYVETTAPVNPYFNAITGTYTIPVSGNYTTDLFVNYHTLTSTSGGELVAAYILLNNTEIVSANWTSPPTTSDTTYNFTKFATNTQYYTAGSVISTSLSNGTTKDITATFIFTITPH